MTALCTALDRMPADDTRRDHVRLFVNAPGGAAAPPYASWYLDERLCGPAADRVAALYAAHGVERCADSGEPADYLSTELEFLYFLTRHELAADATGDRLALRDVLAAQRTFVVGHVARWVPAFTARVREAQPGPVFAAAVTVLDAVTHADVVRLTGSGEASRTPAHSAG